MRRGTGWGLALVAGIMACDQAARPLGSSQASEEGRQVYLAEPGGLDRSARAVTTPDFAPDRVASERGAALAAAWLPPPAPTGTMLIRAARVGVEVDSLERSVAAARELAERLEAVVADTRLETGTHRRRSATLVLRVPVERFDDALAGVEPIGRVESVEATAQDVGEEFVDVTARVENARRLEQRLLHILGARTAALKDVLEVEQALARVREEIERYEGRVRYLRAHTATSTITLFLHEPEPIVGEAGTSVMGEAARQAWRNFVALAVVFVQSLGVTLPLGAFAAAGWLVVRRRRGHTLKGGLGEAQS